MERIWRPRLNNKDPYVNRTIIQKIEFKTPYALKFGIQLQGILGYLKQFDWYHKSIEVPYKVYTSVQKTQAHRWGCLEGWKGSKHP